MSDPRTDARRASERRYKQSPKGRAAQARSNRNFAKSEYGRAVRRKLEKRRRASGVARETHLEAKRRWRIKRQAELQGRVNQIKLDRGCADCGYNAHAVALDFDHVNDDKVTNVASLVGSCVDWPRIEAEIAKCEVVCACCHRVRTLARGRVRRAPTPAVAPNPTLF